MSLMATAVLLASANNASAQLGSLVSPGRLSKAHAQLEGVSNCLQCHSRGQQVAADKCLTCHKPIAVRIAGRKGIHRNVTTDCVTCHVEHAGADADLRPFDQTTFNHGRDAGFALDGLHATPGTTCASCHKTRSFLTAQTTCASCHSDPHKGSLGPACSTCHSTSVKFTSAARGFDHGTTRFPLKGAHGTVACESCHKNKQYKGVAFSSCANCHTDPHASKIGATCASCHTETAWRTTKIDHARTAFPLRGKHATVECTKCHAKSAARVKVRFDTCAACHADTHRGAFAPRDCSACHTESSFRKGAFDHATTAFPLADKHVGLACLACHKAATPAANDFRGLKKSCASCHNDVHRGELGASCEKCHDTRSFTVTSFAHTNPRPFFAGQHAALTCGQCHIETMKPARTAGPIVLRTGFGATPTTCVSCHKDVHLGQLGSSCEGCHSIDTARFGTVGFLHDKTSFALTGKHAPVRCEQCHKVETGSFPSGPGTARRFTGLGAECATCHQDPHNAQLGRACQTCHTTNTFVVSRYTHQNARTLRAFFTGRHAAATCARCHKPLAGAPAGTHSSADYRVPTTCTACHTDVHKGSLGTDCAACHKP
jgi:hypothetical protein